MIMKWAIIGLFSFQQVRAQGASSSLQQAVSDGAERTNTIGGNLARSVPMSPCNWDNDNAFDGNNAFFNSPDSIFIAADDFVTTQPETIFAMQVTYFQTAVHVTGPTVKTSIYSDDGSMAPMDNGLVQQDITTNWSTTPTGEVAFGGDMGFDMTVTFSAPIVLNTPGRYWLAWEFDQGSGLDVSWASSTGGPDGAGPPFVFSSDDNGASWPFAQNLNAAFILEYECPIPSSIPSSTPSSAPSSTPTSAPSSAPTSTPSSAPTSIPMSTPTTCPFSFNIFAWILCLLRRFFSSI